MHTPKMMIGLVLIAVLCCSSYGEPDRRQKKDASDADLLSEYEKKAAAVSDDDPRGQLELTIWCLQKNLQKEYIRHHLLFLKSRSENVKRRDPGRYCLVCQGQGEIRCDESSPEPFKACEACAQSREDLKKKIQAGRDTWRKTKAEEEIDVPDANLAEMDNDKLIAEADRLIAHGLDTDKKALRSDDPFPMMLDAKKKYKAAIKCYKAAGNNAEVKLREASALLFWLEYLMR